MFDQRIDLAPQRNKDRLAGRAVRDCADKAFFEVDVVLERKRFFRREVREHSGDGNVCICRDVPDSDRVETPLEEQS